MKLMIVVCAVLAVWTEVCCQSTPSKRKMGGFCDDGWCTLRSNHPAHFDPYYNGHLCENFNPQENDFSKEYLNLQTEQFGKYNAADLGPYDLSAVWITPSNHQNGVIGLDYTRIRVHISQVTKDPGDPSRYLVKGKSNVKGNVCDFTGEIRLLKAYALKGEYENAGVVFASYTFMEDSTQKHVGTFEGTLESHYYLNEKTKMGFLDTSSDVADGYYNRTYVGTWKGYNATSARKCIWGDYRLPFTFDFDCGDGAMIVCDEYVENGWTSFNDGSEFKISGDKATPKEKWWLNK